MSLYARSHLWGSTTVYGIKLKRQVGSNWKARSFYQSSTSVRLLVLEIISAVHEQKVAHKKEDWSESSWYGKFHLIPYFHPHPTLHLPALIWFINPCVFTVPQRGSIVSNLTAVTVSLIYLDDLILFWNGFLKCCSWDFTRNFVTWIYLWIDIWCEKILSICVKYNNHLPFMQEILWMRSAWIDS